MTACVDNDYDLADIDTTVSLSATQVTIPINIDSITLDAILDLSDDSRIKKVNGEYAVVEEGTFSSSPIHIPSFTAKPGKIDPIKDDLPINLHASTDVSADVAVPVDASELLFSYDISDVKTSVDIDAADVDEAIVSVDYVGVDDGVITATLAFSGISNVANESLIEDLELQLMQGLDLTSNIGTYDPATGCPFRAQRFNYEPQANAHPRDRWHKC